MAKLTYKNAHLEYERKARVNVDHAEERLRDAVDAADDPKTDAGVRAARIQLIRAKTAQQEVEKHADGVEKRRVDKNVTSISYYSWSWQGFLRSFILVY